MQVKFSHNFCSNDTKNDVHVTYQIQCDGNGGSLDVEIVDRDGHESDGFVRIHATLGVNEVLSVQVTYHPGWKAMAGARAVPISKDSLGEMIVSPGRPGEYDISLVYDGGWEGMLCRALSAIALLAVTIAVFRWRFTAVAH